MERKLLITISRQYGSGGRDIGEKLAKRLNIPFYDKELIKLAVQDSGIDMDMFETEEEQAGGEIRYLGSLMNFLGGVNGLVQMSLHDRMYIAQSYTIEQIAQNGSALFVGRCADHILKDYKECVNIFIHAPLEDRKRRAVQEYGEDEKDIEEIISKKDRRRENYYHFYTGRKWGKADNFHITIDSSRFSMDQIVDMLASLIQE